MSCPGGVGSTRQVTRPPTVPAMGALRRDTRTSTPADFSGHRRPRSRVVAPSAIRGRCRLQLWGGRVG